MPRVDIASVPSRAGSGYPSPFDQVARGRSRQRLGDAVGLSQFGVNLTRLAPGAATSHRHWHENEDEFVFILAGHAILVEEGGETELNPGDAAGFKAGVRNGHQIVNRSDTEVLLLEIGTRAPFETAVYSDIDMKVEGSPGSFTYMHKDGTPY